MNEDTQNSSPLQVGDRVRLAEPYNDNPTGATGTVARVSSRGVTVRMDGSNRLLYAYNRRWEVVEKTPVPNTEAQAFFGKNVLIRSKVGAVLGAGRVTKVTLQFARKPRLGISTGPAGSLTVVEYEYGGTYTFEEIE